MGGQTDILQYAAIGRVVTNCNFIELLVDSMCHQLARLDYQVGLCFSAQVSGPGRKFDALFALARLTRGDVSIDKVWQRRKERAIKLAERRNRVVHDYWLPEPTAHPMRFETTARGRLIADWVIVPLDELDTLANELEAFAQELESALEELQRLPEIELSEGKMPSS